MEKEIFSFDAETNGLWGEAFAIGAVVTNADGKILKKWVGHCPIAGKVNSWVEQNVLPKLENIIITHNSYKELLNGFMQFYLENKADKDVIVHMGLPVEARLFLDAHKMGFIGDWDAPYPLIDISAFPEIGDSVDNYNRANKIPLYASNFSSTHNPLYDSCAAAAAYLHIRKRL